MEDTYQSGEKIDNVAGEIILASHMLHMASSKLRDSYKIEKSHEELYKIRTSVYNKAKLYHDKIVPFGTITVSCIKTFCSDTIENSFDDFKDSLPAIIEEAEINVKLCDYTVIFNQAILTEFKKIEDQVIKLRLKYNLDYEVKQNMSNLTMNSVTKSLILGEESEGINAMKPLTESIQNYVEALKKIAGFFHLLFVDLTTLNDNLNKDFNKKSGETFYKRIRKQAGNIVDACVGYTARVPDCKSNIDCIPDECDQNYVDGWPLKVIKEAKKWDDFVDLVNEKTLIKFECRINIEN